MHRGPGGSRPPVSRVVAHRVALPCLMSLVSLGVSTLPAAETPDEASPRDIGLIERSGTRLAQIDITVLGEPEVLAGLTAEDFRIKVNLTKIKEFRLDRLCPIDDAVLRRAAVKTNGAESPARDALPRISPTPSYLFYFDQPYLTMPGRFRAIELAREMVAELLEDGGRIMIVSNGRQLEVIAPFGTDETVLLEALDGLVNDRDQWDLWAHEEQSRVDNVIRTLNEGDSLHRAVGLARRYQIAESVQSERNMRRLDVTLGQFIGLDVPKSVIYFADTLRSNPGEHYLSFFGTLLNMTNPTLGVMDQATFAGGLVFDNVVNQAAANGIRLYPVLAEGLGSPLDNVVMSSAASAATRTVTSSSRVRLEDVYETLNNMAAETGGNAFLYGSSAKKVVERIRNDSSCVFLASFDPSGFREDVPLRVIVEARRDDIRIRSRGRMVFQSESARLVSSLLQAFNEPGTIRDPVSIYAAMVPTGYSRGEYSALLQLKMPGTPLQGSTWDLGASLTAAHKVQQETSGRVAVGGPNVPVILESEWRFKPGAYDLVAVGHEASTNLIATDQITLDWPDPNSGPATICPISLLQPSAGAFLRSDELRNEGSVARTPGETVISGLPTALVGLVCRGRHLKGPLEIERELVGQKSVEFDPVLFEDREERCVQLRDLVPAHTLGGGAYNYVVRLVRDGETLGEQNRGFEVVE